MHARMMYVHFHFGRSKLFHFLGVINSVFRRTNSLRGRHFVPILSLMKFGAATILEVTKPPAHPPTHFKSLCLLGATKQWTNRSCHDYHHATTAHLYKGTRSLK